MGENRLLAIRDAGLPPTDRPSSFILFCSQFPFVRRRRGCTSVKEIVRIYQEAGKVLFSIIMSAEKSPAYRPHKHDYYHHPRTRVIRNHSHQEAPFHYTSG